MRATRSAAWTWSCAGCATGSNETSSATGSRRSSGAQEDLMQARADLHKRKISQQGSDAVSDAEQKEALREATRNAEDRRGKACARQAADSAVASRDRRVPLAFPAAGRPSFRGVRKKPVHAREDDRARSRPISRWQAPTAPVFETPPRAGPLGGGLEQLGRADHRVARRRSSCRRRDHGTEPAGEAPAPASAEAAPLVSGRTS